MNKALIFQEGYNSFKCDGDVFTANPYKLLENRGMDISALQPEATYFYIGWQWAKKEYNKDQNYFLFLDDFRFPEDVTWVYLPQGNWVIARHYQEFINVIEKVGLPAFVSFDFDLDRHGLALDKDLPYYTGVGCAEWLVNYYKDRGVNLPNWAVHSSNHEGKLQIIKILNRI